MQVRGWIKKGELTTEKTYHGSLTYHHVLGSELIKFVTAHPEHLKHIDVDGVRHWVEEGSRSPYGHLVFTVRKETK